jgi:TrmH family RNA methyltransferase
LSGASQQLSYKNPRVQRLRRLLASRDAREAEGRFVLEGLKLVGEALAAEQAIEAVFVPAGWRRCGGPSLSARLDSLLQRLSSRGAEVAELAPGVLERIAGSVAPQPVLAMVERPAARLDDLRGRNLQLVLVCAGAQDPGNVGALVRTAWAAGADAVVTCSGTADPWSPKAVRASAGGVLHLPVVELPSASEALDELGALGLTRLAAVAAGGEDYVLADLARPAALVLGNESAGLPLAALAAHLDGLVSVPMPGGAESLNVAAAAAVVCFEAVRQRRGLKPLQGAAGAGKLAHL